jgi:predicted DNA-binding transcriptional regulator AlpA
MSDRMLEELVLSPDVAATLGVKTSTLAKWRTNGTDPDGAVWLSPTTVAYPRESVRRWLEERRANPKRRGRPPRRVEGNGPKAA